MQLKSYDRNLPIKLQYLLKLRTNVNTKVKTDYLQREENNLLIRD